jgi:hypothetical protein
MVQSNTGVTILDGNTVIGNLTDQNNIAPTQVFSNVVSNTLQCQGNSAISGGLKPRRQATLTRPPPVLLQ